MADPYDGIRKQLTDYILNEAGIQDLREMMATMAGRRLEKLFQTAEAEATIETRADGCVAVKAPMSGILYFEGGSELPVFCKVGDLVRAGDTVALVEAMKLYNEIFAPCSGEVVEICGVRDEHVEADAAIMWIKPSGNTDAPK